MAGDFKLVAECQRIRLAGLSDPMLGVTSDIQPLPHQLRAVYGELLEGRPLRFLPADDPGAGKTITGALDQGADPAGDVKRCLIMAPGGLVDQWQDDSYLKFGLAFEIRTRQFGETVFRASAFDQHQPLIARMDQLSRNEELLAGLQPDGVGHGRASPTVTGALALGGTTGSELLVTTYSCLNLFAFNLECYRPRQ